MKAPEIKNLVDVQAARLDHTNTTLDRLELEHKQLGDRLHDLDKEVALLRQRVDERRRANDMWATWVWAIVGVVIGSVITAAVLYYLGLKK